MCLNARGRVFSGDINDVVYVCIDRGFLVGIE